VVAFFSIFKYFCAKFNPISYNIITFHKTTVRIITSEGFTPFVFKIPNVFA
jgi:hypothetical protein